MTLDEGAVVVTKQQFSRHFDGCKHNPHIVEYKVHLPIFHSLCNIYFVVEFLFVFFVCLFLFICVCGMPELCE